MLRRVKENTVEQTDRFLYAMTEEFEERTRYQCYLI